jgi:two-component system phosphate regulon sensor histidine kinase PhoR
LQAARARVGAVDLRQGQTRLQSLLEQLRTEGDWEYGWIVSGDGEILAHTSPTRVGQVYQEPAGEHSQLGEVERIRLAHGLLQSAILEYRIPLRGDGQELAGLHLAVREPDVREAIAVSSRPLPWLLAGPGLGMLLGALLIRRSLMPLAGVCAQLGRAAVDVCPAELELDEVPARGVASLGWNRLVQAHRRRKQEAGLEQRLDAALRPVLAKQGNEVLNSLPDGLAVTDEAGRITFANRAFGAICGGDGNGGLTGKTVVELLDLSAQEGGARALLDAHASSRTVVADVPLALQGSQRVFRVACHPCWGTDGRADSSRHVWSVRDITQQQLVSQMRDQFLQTAAHELRTPLANIKAYAETLSLDETIERQKQKDFYNVINAEATRLARLIEDLLSVSSMEVGALSLTRQETDVGRLLAEVVDKVRPLMEQKQIAFETALPQKWPKMHLDKDKITVSLVNVLGNAAKYTPAGGRVAMRVTVSEGKLTIVVEDTGIGIAAEELPRISTKFFRSADPRVREQPGSGLGLSLVKEVVRIHGGSLDIASELNRGTTIHIVLPIM